MNVTKFAITEFLSASKPVNHRGQRICISERISSALIFPICGKLEFTLGEDAVIADPKHPVFIPRGVSYVNRCIEDAQSLMFNIQVEGCGERIIPLLLPDTRLLNKIFDEIILLNANLTIKKKLKIFEKLYNLIIECVPNESGDNATLLSPALELIEKRYHETDLKLEDLSAACNISKPYLYKLFKKEFDMTPFGYITRTRMERAKILLLEMYPVCEVAAMVGYSDVYQFSRAFKRFFKCSPTKAKKLFLI